MGALLGEVGGNVAELRRRLAAVGGVSVPSASTLLRVIRRDRRAGRALRVEREPVVAGPRRSDPLSELGLNVVAGQGTGGHVFLREQKHLAQVPLLVPGAQVVHTSAVRSVLRTVAHAAAVGAVVCLYGDAGQGKTVALQYTLSQLPHPARARRVHVGVNPTVPELRRVLADALELGRRLPRGPHDPPPTKTETPRDRGHLPVRRPVRRLRGHHPRPAHRPGEHHRHSRARAMMCIHGGAGFGTTLAVSTCLRALEPGEDVRKVTFRARPTARAVRYELFTTLDLAGEAPRHPSEFNRLLKVALAECPPRTFLVDEAQWLNGEAFEYFRYLRDEPSTQLAIIFVGGEG